MFCFKYVPRTQRGGRLSINIITAQSYYKSVAQNVNNGWASRYYGKLVVSGHCDFFNDNTVATRSPNQIYVNEMSIDSEQTIIMTKTQISADEITPFEVALNDMNFVPDAYFEFLSNQNNSKFLCEMANFWVDSSTMTGEWNTNGSIVPIRIKLHEKVPYVEIYDISSSSEKLILKAYANVIDATSIELVEIEGDIFYSTPSAPVMLVKNN